MEMLIAGSLLEWETGHDQTKTAKPDHGNRLTGNSARPT
jgi:hypothetical protein